MKISIQEFKNTILGLRYEKLDEEILTSLYSVFNDEVLKVYDIVKKFQDNEIVSSVELNTEAKDQYINPASSYIISRPVEVDLSLAYTNTIISIHPNFKEYAKDLLEKIQEKDPHKRKVYKFLLNYTIGNIFKNLPDLSKKVRQIVIIEVDEFLKRHNIEDYVVQKKRDGVILDLPSTFILGNLKDDPRFKVTEFKSLLLNYIDQRKQIYLTKNDEVDLKGIGLVPPGILKVYKKMIQCYLTHGTTNKKSFICIGKVVNDFMSKFDMENFLEPNSKGDLIYKIKLVNNELTVTPDNVQKISRGFSIKDIDIMYYYKTHLESWIQTIIINSQI